MKLTLNVGCGEKTYKEYPIGSGYKCINFDVRAELPNIDEVGDIRDLSRFKDEYFLYAIASDILEHAPLSDTEVILKEWKRVLKTGGIIEFRVPNLEAICKAYVEKRHDAKLTSWLLYGGQDYFQNYHFICFDRPWLKSIIESLGFEEIEYREEGNNFVMKVRKI